MYPREWITSLGWLLGTEHCSMTLILNVNTPFVNVTYSKMPFFLELSVHLASLAVLFLLTCLQI